MDFKQKNGVSIDEAFKKFHKANPQAYSWFKHYFYYFKGRGKKRIPAKMIAECMRMEVKLVIKGSGFKIDNSLISNYARLLVRDYPQHAKFIEFRRLKSEPVQQEIF